MSVSAQKRSSGATGEYAGSALGDDKDFFGDGTVSAELLPQVLALGLD